MVVLQPRFDDPSDHSAPASPRPNPAVLHEVNKQAVRDIPTCCFATDPHSTPIAEDSRPRDESLPVIGVCENL